MTDAVQGGAAQWSPERSAAGGHNPYLIAFVVSIATFMEVLDTTIANVALRHIAGGLAVGIDESTYVDKVRADCQRALPFPRRAFDGALAAGQTTTRLRPPRFAA